MFHKVSAAVNHRSNQRGGFMGPMTQIECVFFIHRYSSVCLGDASTAI